MNCYGWDELTVGMKCQFEAAFTTEMAQAFASISGDVNPLHSDHEYAASLGFEAPALFGMLTSSLYSQLVGVHLPGRHARLEGIDIDFHSPCYAGEQLIVAGEVVFLLEAYHRVELRASIRSADGTLVSKARIRVGMHV